MKADYKNWVPKGMAYGLTAAAGVLSVGAAAAELIADEDSPIFVKALPYILGAGALGCAAFGGWSWYARGQFSYEGNQKLSKQIIEGTAEYINLPEGGTCLDVGCGSGALTKACAKRSPAAFIIGIDRWGAEYASFSKKLCYENAAAEGVDNVSFRQGDACKLDFPDETFDAVTSNYVYHNITGKNKQGLLKETLRVLKKGGTFAIHDIMSPQRYGDMGAFIRQLKEEGYETAELIPTDCGKFMTSFEAGVLMLKGSALLVGRK